VKGDGGDDEQPERERAKGDAKPNGKPQVTQLRHVGPQVRLERKAVFLLIGRG
jgi:hypothetical protein